jgi:bacterioferritin-associated ferredoxin
MYVCLCNAYRESHVREVIKTTAGSGPVTVEQIYARLGSEPRCGQCLRHVQCMIDSARETSPNAKAS